MVKSRKIRDGEGTREKVLAAAGRTFARYGFAGTSISRVARASGISEGLILHHFGSKKNLYEAVRSKALEEYLGSLSRALSFRDEAPLLVKETLKIAFRYLKENEQYRRLQLWGHLENVTDPDPREIRFTRRFLEIVGETQSKGVVRADVSPEVLLLAIRGAMDHYIRSRSLLAGLGAVESGADGADGSEREGPSVEETSSSTEDQFLDELFRLIAKTAR
jgi:AcrR family transcriptional regulator